MSPRALLAALRCGVVLVLGLAGPLVAHGAPSAPAVTTARPWDESERESWQQRVAEARAELERAQQRRDAAETAVDRMRHRKHPRGEAREALFAEREAARADAAGAERALDALLDEARRAGVPPGWLRAPAAQAPAAPE